jgi:alkylation response protein AidB-like acyl-CoA dehydrogenase
MELVLSPEDEAFRQEVRAFIRDKLDPETKRKVELGYPLDKNDYVQWHKRMFEQGWAAPNWPVEYGGPGWTPIQRHIYDEELALGSTPRVIPFGVSMVAPVIYTFGSDEQKAKYLPRILSFDDWWCQGYSEPGSGSDLSSLRTKAVRDGDHYIVNGQKTWTTLAQYADMIFCLVRTDDSGKQQEGISFLLIDMKTPGISVTPIETLDGDVEINSVFFEDVRVPVENLVGEEGKGWTYAKFLLGHERTGIAAVGRSKRQLARLKTIAEQEVNGDITLAEDSDFQERVSQVEIELFALEAMVIAALEGEARGNPPGPEASILKIKGVEVQQAITELAVEAVGNHAHAFAPDTWDIHANEPGIGPDYAATAAPIYFNWRKASIYGGSNEIQREIIAKRVLGL